MNKNNIQELLKSIYSLINEAQALQIEYTNNLKINDKSKEDFLQKKKKINWENFKDLNKI